MSRARRQILLLLGVAGACAARAVAQQDPSADQAPLPDDDAIEQPVDQPTEPPADSPDGPVIVGESRQHWKGVELTRLRTFFDFFGEYTYDRLRQRGQPTVKERETRLRETLGLDGQVFIGHPNLITIDGTAELGIEDRFVNSDTIGDGHDTDFVDIYDLRALILGNGPIPLTLYSRRDQTNIHSDFGTSVDDVTWENGAIAQIVSDWAPTTLHYFHLDNEQTDPLGDRDSTRIQDTFTGQSNMALGEGQRLELTYTYDHIDETRSDLFSNVYDRNDAAATHTYNFGDKDQHNLRSYLRYYEETGDFPLQTLLLDEQLTLRHTDRFETRYFGAFETRDVRGDDQRLGRLTGQARYRLFDSLITTGNLGWRRLESGSDFTSDDLFVTGSAEYTKKVPMGRLDASAGLGFNHQDNSERGSTVSVAGEPVILVGTFPATINRRNIIESSVVVRRTNGQILFENSDYTLLVYPDRAEIRRVIGGSIAEGETVLVDYDVGPEPSSRIDTQTVTISLRYTFDEGWVSGLSVYGSYRTTDFHLDTADPSRFVLDDSQTLIYGIEYTRGGFNIKAERENRDSNVNPYDTTRLQARYDLVTGIGSSIGALVAYDIVEYTIPVNTLTVTRVEGNWTQRLGESLSGKLRLLYRDEHEDLSGDTQGFEQYLELHFRKGQTTMFANVRNSYLEGPSSDTFSQGVQIGFRRQF